jgi:plasmid stabilization system protein ParE
VRQTRQIRILSLAVQDLERGRDFYERQQAGIGDYFLDSLFADIDALLLYAGIHERHFGYCRALAKRFPFAIYYRLNEDEIQVWRVLDCRSSPLRIRRALSDS